MSFQKIYETERLYVRPLTEEDVLSEHYQKWFYDEDVTRWNSHGLFPYTESQIEEFIERIKSGNEIIWAIIVKDISASLDHGKEIHIGNISLQRIDWINRSAEFAIVLGEKEYWGKGYGTEAAILLFNHGFDKLNLNRIWTGTSSKNKGMQKIAQKLGMLKEGIFKEAMYLNGEYTDIIEYRMLKSIWENFLRRIRRAECPKSITEKIEYTKEDNIKDQNKMIEVFDEVFTEYQDKMLKTKDQIIIKQISDIRTKNNKNWMKILEVAMEDSSEKTKEILYHINECDKEISKLVGKLTDGKNKKRI